MTFPESLAPPLWGLIPAAGFSRRMGTHKLLLHWGETTVIARLLAELKRSQLTGILILVREEDAALREELLRITRFSSSGLVHVVVTSEPTADMLASVRRLLDWGSSQQLFASTTGFLMIPADHPLVESGVVAELAAAAAEHPDQIFVPVHGGQRGHPTLFPAQLLDLVQEIPAGTGLNWLARSGRLAVREVPVDSPGIHADLDTPADVEKWLA